MRLRGLERRGGRREGLRTAATWNIAGTLVYTACQWGVLVATVRLTTPADVGALSLGFAITAPVFLFFHLRLRSASATDVNDQFHPSDYINLRAATTALALLIAFAVCRLCRLPAHEAQIVLWVGLAKALESGSDLCYGFSQKAGDLRIVSISMIARGTLSLVVFPALLYRTHLVALAVAGLCATWGLVLMLIDVPYSVAALRREGKHIFPIRWNTRATADLTRTTFPLGLSTMLMSVAANMPRYFIARYLGATDLGIFTAMGYLAMATSVIVSALAESSLAPLARHVSAGDVIAARALLRTIVTATVGLSFAGIVFSAVLGWTTVRMLYGAAYASSSELLIGMMTAAGIANLASVYGYALVAGHSYVSYLRSLFALALTTAVACIVMIPLWGTKGAVLACAAGYLIQLIWSCRKTHTMLALPQFMVATAPVTD
jgi:O-antigen/teichoic acid export membrane protein